MTQENRIPISRTVRWRRIRYRAIPVLSFLVALVASSWLWRNYGGTIQGVGAVDAPRVDVSSPTAGLVISLPHQSRGQWLIYDHVQAGEVIARIEDQQLENSKNLLQQELMKLLDEVTLQAEAAGEGGDAAAKEAIRGAWQFEKTRLLSLDEQLSPELQVASGANRDPVSPPPELRSTVSAASRDALARIRETRHRLELRANQINRSAKDLELTSPISGTLVALHRWPGQTVPPGGRIATIAADYGRHIVSYIPEGSPLVARPGMQVTLRARAAGARRLTSEVEQVGRRVERIPGHQVAAAKSQMWGTPVRIKMLSDALLQPGALVDVVYSSSSVH
jgi:multidrug resistance efflux pump